MAGKTGPAMFADLTNYETWILADKLTSGATMADRGLSPDHDMSMRSTTSSPMSRRPGGPAAANQPPVPGACRKGDHDLLRLRRFPD